MKKIFLFLSLIGFLNAGLKLDYGFKYIEGNDKENLKNEILVKIDNNMIDSIQVCSCYKNPIELPSSITFGNINGNNNCNLNPGIIDCTTIYSEMDILDVFSNKYDLVRLKTNGYNEDQYTIRVFKKPE